MQLTNLNRWVLLTLAHSLLLIPAACITGRSANGQQFPPFPENRPNAGGTSGPNQPAANSNYSRDPRPPFNSVSKDEHGLVSEDEHGLRRVGESGRTYNGNQGMPLQNPAVISSSYHRAVIESGNEPSTMLPNESVPPGRPVKDKFVSESSSRLTPLSPPNTSAAEGKTQTTSSVQMLLSVGSSLMVVIGLFMGSIWLYRKSLGRMKSGGLPKNVVQILGRTPFAARQQLVLLRFGSKLVLVSMVQGETRTISEITEPLEVDRLAGLCEGHQPGSISSSFREILSSGGRA